VIDISSYKPRDVWPGGDAGGVRQHAGAVLAQTNITLNPPNWPVIVNQTANNRITLRIISGTVVTLR